MREHAFRLPLSWCVCSYNRRLVRIIRYASCYPTLEGTKGGTHTRSIAPFVYLVGTAAAFASERLYALLRCLSGDCFSQHLLHAAWIRPPATRLFSVPRSCRRMILASCGVMIGSPDPRPRPALGPTVKASDLDYIIGESELRLRAGRFTKLFDDELSTLSEVIDLDIP